MDPLLIENIGNFIISMAIGALIGIEREHSHIGKERFGGIRTFILIALMGTLAAFLSQEYGSIILILIFASIAVFVMMGYIGTLYIEKNIGIVSELASLLTFLFGFMCYTGETRDFAVVLAVLTTLVLATKNYTHGFVNAVKDIELLDTLKFALITLVILPLIPNREIVLLDAWPVIALNLYQIWLMVVLISAVSYIGYIFMKVFGTGRGIVMTGVLGGLVSSTAVTLLMAEKVKANKNVMDECVFAAVIASSMMFIRILVVVAIINVSLIPKIAVPVLFTALTGIILSALVWQKRSSLDVGLDVKSPLSIGHALKFGAFFALVMLMIKVLYSNFQTAGIYATSIISGIADVDAITLSMSLMAKNSEILPVVATVAIVLAAIINTFVKFSIAWGMGTHQFGKRVGAIFAVMILVGLLSLLLLH